MALIERSRRRSEHPRRWLSSLKYVAVAWAIGCGTDAPSANCSTADTAARWTLSATESGGLSVAGFFTRGDTLGSFEGDFLSPDGSSAPMENPVRVILFTSDSVDLLMLPNEMRLRGSCEAGEFKGTFSLPQPPFADIQGSFTLRP